MTATILPEAPGSPHRLGRHVHHDPQSLAYAAPALPYAALKSIRWTRRIDVLDQGDLGSCTGNAAVGWLGTDNVHRQGLASAPSGHLLDETYAVDVYAYATDVDNVPGEYPPEDTGSTGLAVAKVLKHRGFIQRYRHAFGLRSTLSALQSGPVLLGTVWLEEMFQPTTDGELTPDGAQAGGHEIVLDEIDVERRRVWLTNSWSAEWGVDGRAWLSWDHLGYLLGQQGDVVVPG
ncbi:hypothetical protein FDG2_0722 [Candidatus Protofrankia californiensis]|uniref:Peptidase C1A papain n=1 Tax=Candidatus Protofrankia californiensis TaxID=1839754 RepID=A0A1C3NU62_9ACTN|nr:hypothetical protein FDG2_0722 [Candidatus Protofrankia californiensis]